MFLSEEFRAFLTKLMNGLSGLLEGVNLDFNFDLMPGISVAGYVLLLRKWVEPKDRNM